MNLTKNAGLSTAFIRNISAMVWTKEYGALITHPVTEVSRSIVPFGWLNFKDKIVLAASSYKKTVFDRRHKILAFLNT